MDASPLFALVLLYSGTFSPVIKMWKNGRNMKSIELIKIHKPLQTDTHAICKLNLSKGKIHKHTHTYLRRAYSTVRSVRSPETQNKIHV